MAYSKSDGTRLDMSRTEICNIDFLEINKLDLKEQRILAQYLKESNQSFWKAKNIYKHIHEDKTYLYSFNQNMLKRARKENRAGLRLEIQDTKILSRGRCGEVYSSCGLIRLDDQTNQFMLKNSNRIIKETKSGNKHEYEMLLKASHLHPKPPITDPITATHYLVMDKVQGETLEHVLKNHTLHLNQRLELSLALLHAIKDQLIDKGVSHGDLHLRNIMLDSNCTPIKVVIIDYGTAQDIRSRPNKDLASLNMILGGLFELENSWFRPIPDDKVIEINQEDKERISKGMRMVFSKETFDINVLISNFENIKKSIDYRFGQQPYFFWNKAPLEEKIEEENQMIVDAGMCTIL